LLDVQNLHPQQQQKEQQQKHLGSTDADTDASSIIDIIYDHEHKAGPQPDATPQFLTGSVVHKTGNDMQETSSSAARNAMTGQAQGGNISSSESNMALLGHRSQ
jgi:hypothetical protein